MIVQLAGGSEYVVEGEEFDDADGETRTAYAALIFDSHRGQYIAGCIIGLALKDGWQGPDGINADLQALAESGATEEVDEYSQLAETWLNNNFTTPGFEFGWRDGDYFLADGTWWEQQEQ
jgi:hypothetical protein